MGRGAIPDSGAHWHPLVAPLGRTETIGAEGLGGQRWSVTQDVSTWHVVGAAQWVFPSWSLNCCDYIAVCFGSGLGSNPGLHLQGWGISAPVGGSV